MDTTNSDNNGLSEDMDMVGGNAVTGSVLYGQTHDVVNHPVHYCAHPSGVECIQVTEHMGFCLGNAVKYIWRAGLKGGTVEDLRKAEFYIRREIDRLSIDRLSIDRLSKERA